MARTPATIYAVGSAPKPAARARNSPFPYLGGLDGLRAVAVIAVVLYHAELNGVNGGFLGVEVFFVLSGYLITSLLLNEWTTEARVNLGAFWARRARRLLPALFVLLAGTLTFAVIFHPDEVAGMRNDALAALAYVTNWYLIFNHRSYFEQVGRPPILQHLWSLAVEEQFYLLWPLLFLAGMHWLHRRWRVLRAVLIAAAVSAGLMALLYQPSADPSRLYYGTDTRAAGLLLGSALALAWQPRARPRGAARARIWLLDLAGLAALTGLIWTFHLLDETQPFLYRGGFVWVAGLTLVVIAAVAHPATVVSSRLLGWSVLRWIGQRSYSIYLWHWPVVALTRPHLDVPLDDWPLLVLRLGLTLGLAELSYRYVERPIREGGLGRAWQSLRLSYGDGRRRLLRRWGGAVAVGGLLALLVGGAVVRATPPAPPSYLVMNMPITAGPLPTPIRVSDADATSAPDATPIADAAPPPDAAPVGSISAFGDSVMLGAAPALQQKYPNIDIDAVEGRQIRDGIQAVREHRDAGQLGDVVVVHLGDNGYFSDDMFDDLMGLLDGRKVIIVNDVVPRRWEGSNNDILAAGVGRYSNARLADWHAASAERYDLFYEDGMHLRPAGAEFYANLIAATIAR